MTGTFWFHEQTGVQPDVLAFGKKTQVCGILAGPKLDEVEGHVFQTSSRINSTWGGNLVDMVRFDRILEIIEEDHLVQHAADAGAYLQNGLHALAARHPSVTQVRGRGLLCAFDLPTTGVRNRVLDVCYDEGAVVLGCGTHTVRFRPPLTITTGDIDEGLALLDRALGMVEAETVDPNRKGRK